VNHYFFDVNSPVTESVLTWIALISWKIARSSTP